MRKACLLIAALAALASGCAGPQFIGPRAMVEDRRVAPERLKAVVSRAAVRSKVSDETNLAPAQSACGNYANNLIHPVHFDAGQCPLLRWEVRAIREGH